MTAPLPFTQAALRRMIAAARKEGLRVVGIRPDGTVIVDSGDNHHPFVPPPASGGHDAPSSIWEDLEA